MMFCYKPVPAFQEVSRLVSTRQGTKTRGKVALNLLCAQAASTGAMVSWVHVCMCEGMCVQIRGKHWGIVISFHLVKFWGGIHVVRFGSACLYSLIYLAVSPPLFDTSSAVAQAILKLLILCPQLPRPGITGMY